MGKKTVLYQEFISFFFIFEPVQIIYFLFVVKKLNEVLFHVRVDMICEKLSAHYGGRSLDFVEDDVV